MSVDTNSNSQNICTHDSDDITSAATALASAIDLHQRTSIHRSPSASCASSRETNPGCRPIHDETPSTVPRNCSRETPSLSLNTTSSSTFDSIAAPPDGCCHQVKRHPRQRL